jgi:hypothetical protein
MGHSKKALDLSGYVTARELQEFCLIQLEMSGDVLPAGPFYKRKAIKDAWRWFTKRHSDIFSLFSTRRGRGKGRGVETYYRKEFQPIMVGAMRLRIKKQRPLEIDKWLIPELINAGLLKERFRFLFDLIYSRAVCDVLNLSEIAPVEFKKALLWILFTRGKRVEFEWHTKAIRKRVSIDPAKDPKPTKGDVNLLSMGVDLILQGGQPKQGMRWDMELFEIESIIDDFHKQRLQALDLFKRTLSGDAQSADTLEQMGAAVIDAMPSDWQVDTPEDLETDRTLRRRPEHLVDYALLRLKWMWQEEQRSSKNPIGSYIELLQSRFLCCPECGLIELRFRKGDKNKCRVCRGMDGEVKLRQPRKR